GWKSERAAEFPAMDHPTANGVGPAEQARRGGEIAVADRLADPRAADPLAIDHDRRDGFEGAAADRRLGLEKFHITMPTLAEAPVFADGDRFDRQAEEAVEKRVRFHRSEGQIEIQCDEKTGSELADDAFLVTERGEQGRWRFGGSDHT